MSVAAVEHFIVKMITSSNLETKKTKNIFPNFHWNVSDKFKTTDAWFQCAGYKPCPSLKSLSKTVSVEKGFPEIYIKRHVQK